MHAVACTLGRPGETPPREFRITHQEMIKGIAGHGYTDTLVVPILENTPHEADLAESMAEAILAYPRSNAVLVRRHGVYVWGDTWEAAKTQAECYHYLFEAATAMRAMGLDPAEVPTGAATGVGAHRAYGSGRERESTYAGLAAGGGVSESTGGGGGSSSSSSSSGSGSGSSLQTPVRSSATEEGWHGAAGTSSRLELGAAGEGHVHAGGCCGGGASASAVSSLPTPAKDSFTHVILDVEGCTTSLAFVTDTLFPYALRKLPSWLSEHWGSAGEAGEDVAALCALSAADVAAGVEGAKDFALEQGAIMAAWRGEPAGSSSSSREEAHAALVANVTYLMRGGLKKTALKALQGHIWRDGYQSGELKGQLFEDTLPALQAWQRAGKRVYIYSSGSREAQRLLFTHSEAGDVTGLLSGYFDTSVGLKVESSSYKDICATLGLAGGAASRALFATDSMAEAVAARAAGMQVVVTVRPGNNPLPESAKEYPCVDTLLALA
jgi:2,3-diketo-5-methylthio-1-phosphopentane phosphatase